MYAITMSKKYLVLMQHISMIIKESCRTNNTCKIKSGEKTIIHQVTNVGLSHPVESSNFIQGAIVEVNKMVWGNKSIYIYLPNLNQFTQLNL